MSARAQDGNASGAGRPPVFCDLVMKGGVTSGVTYPLAIVELAKRFHLKNLGGTSAGAISAAFAAAAELRRRKGSDAGFRALEELPGWLSQRGRLLQLFAPDPATKSLFSLAVKGAAYKRFRIPRLAMACFALWPLALSLSLLPGLLCLLASGRVLLAGRVEWWLGLAASVGGLALMASGFALVLSRRLQRALRAVIHNGFGLSSGMGGGARTESPPLSPWLHERLNALAGSSGKAPLTFSELWNAPVPERGRALLSERDRSIDLQMVTTCLSHGRPYQLPQLEGNLYFDPLEFARLFPQPVVDWMVEHAGSDAEGAKEARGVEGNRLLALPEPGDLPVVVAVRMSLSFPLLISAVPLWAIDTHASTKDGQEPRAERIWFSDGGISSNFPIHFFDVLVPRWPTVAISLRQLPAQGEPKSSSSRVRALRSREVGLGERWIRFEGGGGIGDLFGFLRTILDSMQNWYDNSYLPLPGYRDRVVELGLSKHEGGLNLDMSPDTIEKLTREGREAGRLMAERFTRAAGEEQRLSWDDHRWTRYRSGMAALAGVLAGLSRVIEGEANWPALIRR
ncbi:MAG TPA: hypothetical protein VKA63_11110, partial [Candidatus Krumholzibacteria bacterium]|nr:hypothetical protein [Candidatus Krumholzibacteria bacterium]